MEQDYPMKSYTTYHSNEVRYDAPFPQNQWQQPHLDPAYQIHRKPFNRGFNSPHPGYEPLNEPNAGYAQSNPQKRRKSGVFSSLMWWLPELLASLVAITCLVVIYLILWIYNGRPIAEVNLPASLTLNGMIAAISTIARVALMVPVASGMSQESWVWFSSNARQQQCRSRLLDLDLSDNASRGAWGSLLFLIFARRRWLAYLGAFVTIIALAFGTFTQQLLAVDESGSTGNDASLAPGNLPRRETWQYYNSVPSENILTLPFDIRAAVYNGILSGKTDPITATCATGNCTWPITPSLAVCGECSQSGYILTCDDVYCNYTMPSGSSLLLSSSASEGIGFAVQPNHDGGIYNASTGDRLYLVHFDTVGVPYGTLGSAYQTTKKTASECALWMCVQSYHTSMANGRLQQEITMEFSNLTAPTTSVVGAFSNFTFADLPKEMNPDPDVTYNASLVGMASFGTSMYGLFNGTGFLDLSSSAISRGPVLSALDTSDAIWNASSNLDAWIKNVAASMTNALRYDDTNPHPPARQATIPAPSRSRYNGTATTLTVKVQWWWSILPVVCVVLSILFLILVMVKTAGSPVAPWKSSLLTFLFFDVDQEVKLEASGRINERKGVSEAVGNTRVFLREDNGGKWAFKTA